MTLEDQVTSLELSKKLKKLGVKQKSLFWWTRPTNDFGKPEGRYFIDYVETKCNDGDCDHQHVSAFTVAELGEMLLVHCKSSKQMGVAGGWFCHLDDNPYNIFEVLTHRHEVEADTEANARAKMLIYLIENNLLSRESEAT